MGVSATGKTSVAKALSAELRVEFIEGDDLHPPENLAKMSAGEPLTDDDRLPWLQAIAEVIAQRSAAGTPTIVTCSALRRTYRDLLRGGAPALFFLHLHADFEVLLSRMGERTKHFMPTSLLQSQFDTLEPLEPDELGAVIDVAPPLDDVVAAALKKVRPYLPSCQNREGL